MKTGFLWVHPIGIWLLTEVYILRTKLKVCQKYQEKATDWEKVFAKDILGIGLVSKIYLKTLNTQQLENKQFKNVPKTLTGTSPKKIFRSQTSI